MMLEYSLMVLVGGILSSSYVDTTTHWMVTEDGKLQEQPDSMLSMKKHYDLVAFMHQEERVEKLEKLKTYIVENQAIVDSTDDKDDGFEEMFLSTEESCIKAVKRLPEFDLYISTVLPLENKGIRAEDHIDLKLSSPPDLTQPFCNSPLEFSIHAFEHLEGVQNRKNLQGLPELGLKSAITHQESEDEYGHLVNVALQHNQTSWVLYNMAAFYWRIKGNSNEAIECLRRAMHYSPSSYRDIAYVSLGNILHRSRYSHEAAIVVEAALDLSNSLNVNHFTLGNIYAVLTEYNKSIECFDNTLALQPEFEAAEKRRWAVICHAKLERALESQHSDLQSALEKLKEYQKKHETMQSLSEKVAMEQAYRTDRVMRNAEFIQHQSLRKSDSKPMMGEHCELAVKGDERTVVCKWKEPDYDRSVGDIAERFSNIPITETEVLQLQNIEVEDDRVNALELGTFRDSYVAEQESQDYSKPVRPPTYPTTEAPPAADEAVSAPHLAADWPPFSECDSYKTRQLTWDEYPSTFLPPENKGFDSRVFLAEAIDIEAGQQHPLPWYRPLCVNIVDLKQGDMFLDRIPSFQQRDKVTLGSADPNLTKILLSWVNNGDAVEEEVGQRILTALKQNLAPRWLLYNLAGLYWRAAGNNYHAIECLRRSLHFVPADYVDVPLVNVANIFTKWEKFEDALNMTRQALIFCPHEPITHFTQANLLAITHNDSGAIHHYQKALEYNPDYTEALDMLRNLKCFNKYHKAAALQADQNICKARKKPEDCGTSSCSTLSICGGDLMNMESTINGDLLSLETFLRRNNIIDPSEADAMKELHKLKGLCNGNECDQLIHKPGTDPYIKIKLVAAGKWSQRLLFIGKDEVLEEKPDECNLLKDGKRVGCDDTEFTTHEKRLEQLSKLLSELLLFIEQQKHAGQILVDSGRKLVETGNAQNPLDIDELKGFVDIDSYLCQTGKLIKICDEFSCDSICVEDVASEIGDATDVVCVMTDKKDKINCFSKKDASPDQIELPEVNPRERISLPTYKFQPSPSDCSSYQDIDFQYFISTWLSVAARGLDYTDNQVTLADVAELLDLEEEINMDQVEAPLCEAKFGASVSMFDHLPSIADKEKLDYSSENVLKDVIQMLGTKEEDVEIVGTRISKALAKNPTSWALGCLGALYWRVQGHAPKAINCLRMALMYAPEESRHIPLLSLANILHKAGSLNDALEIALAALQSSPETVVIHFSIGNMYAAQNNFEKAVEYYQSTLALQEKFEPARERLMAIMCKNLINTESDANP